MEKKLIALFLIALVGGLGGGYGLNYVIYQPQIQNLHNDVNALNDRFDTINMTLGSTQTSVASLEDELNMLNSDVANLDSTVEMMENRTWHEVYSIEAFSDITTGTFQLKGSSVRVMWIATSEYSTGEVSFILHFSNATPYAIWASSGVMTANNAALELIETGNY